MADQGHYGQLAKDKSRQGTYLFTADGTFLASINTLSANLILDTMKQGLVKWRGLPAADREPNQKSKSQSTSRRFEHLYPSDGLVLSVYARDLTARPRPDTMRLPTWNRDSAWFSKEEAEKLIPDNANVGDRFPMPAFFVQRLSKLHVVDSVKGQTEAFTNEEVAESTVTAVVVSKRDDRVRLELSGSTKGIHETGQFQRGVETKLMGKATFDIDTKRFSQFEFIAIGERWGMTKFNDREKELDRSSIGYSFELAEPDDDIVVPGIIWSYDAPWMKNSK